MAKLRKDAYKNQIYLSTTNTSASTILYSQIKVPLMPDMTEWTWTVQFVVQYECIGIPVF